MNALTQMSSTDLADTLRAIAEHPGNRIMSVHALTLKHIADVIAKGALFSVETVKDEA